MSCFRIDLLAHLTDRFRSIGMAASSETAMPLFR